MSFTTAQLEALSQEAYTALLEQLNEDYHNYEDQDGTVTKQHALSDRSYDHYVEVYERRFGKWTRVGAPAASTKRPWQRKARRGKTRTRSQALLVFPLPPHQIGARLLLAARKI
jgi:hypothetical protein